MEGGAGRLGCDLVGMVVRGGLLGPAGPARQTVELSPGAWFGSNTAQFQGSRGLGCLLGLLVASVVLGGGVPLTFLMIVGWSWGKCVPTPAPPRSSVWCQAGLCVRRVAGNCWRG